MDILTIVAFVAVLGPLILLHEIGHFVGAKLTGVRVEEFGFGWPPRLFTFWQSPSRLTVGGRSIITPKNFRLAYNLQVGQHVEATVSQDEQFDTLHQLRVLDPDADDVTPRRESIGPNLVIRGALTALDRGTAYTLNWIPLGGFCRLTGEEDPTDPRSLAAQPKRERLLTLVGGPAVNLIVAILLFTVAFASGVPEPVDSRVVIKQIAAESPAAKADLQLGDVIVKANGTPVEFTSELIDIINANAGETIVLTLERDGHILEQAVEVRQERPSDGRVGIVIANQADTFIARPMAWSKALGYGVDQFWFSVKQMVQLPAMLIRGQVSAEEVRPLGPVGISQIAADAIERSNQEQSWFTILFFAGAISMALGVTNLLPLPALDGGRIMFVLLEAVRGRRIDPAKEGLVHLIGLALLMSLLLIMTLQEIINPVTSPF